MNESLYYKYDKKNMITKKFVNLFEMRYKILTNRVLCIIKYTHFLNKWLLNFFCCDSIFSGIIYS